MLGPVKAAELAANSAEVSWLAPGTTHTRIGLFYLDNRSLLTFDILCSSCLAPVAADGADSDAAAVVQASILKKENFSLVFA